MTIVIDENVSLELAQLLRKKGHDVTAIAELSGRGMSDNEVWSLTKQNIDSVLITRDFHFTNHTRFNPQEVGGIIFIRPGNLTSEQEISLSSRFFEQYSLDSFRGKLVTLSKQRVTMR